MTPARRLGHWAAVALLLAAVGVAVVFLLRDGVASGTWFLVAVVVWLLVRLLRAVVAVWIDPDTGEVALFRAAGGAVRTGTDRLRRLDRGPLDAYVHLQRRDTLPLRIVTDDGTATVSIFFTRSDELGDALASHAPQLRDAR